MAQKRMFSKLIVETDAFLDMPQSTQLLYFHLNMEADDDGFVASPKKVMRIIGASDDDYKILIGKRFIIPFQTGICVIKHWLIHNYIRKDTYNETKYLQEKSILQIKDNGAYTERQRSVDESSTQIRLDKVSIDKNKREDLDTHTIFELFKDKQEADKFISYWTEKNPRTGKQRWTGEKYFDLKRRVNTWLSRTNQFEDKDGKINIIR